MEKRCLCIDVGGTAIKYALIDDARNLTKHGEVPTPTDNTEHYLEVLEGICRQFDGQIRGVAMSVPGIIDSENGICITAGWLHYANGLHLGEELTKRTGLPVSVMNDAKAAGLAEAAWGSLSDCKDSVVILIGSGIGGALIKDGKVHFGRHGSAGEFSNIALSENVDMPGSLWYAQNGTPRLVQMVSGAKGIPADQLNGRILFEQANAGDPVVLAALDRFTRGIALQIFNLQMIYDPEKFAIGGGISRQKLFLESIQKNLDELYTIYPEKSFPRAQLTTCRFFNEANLYGAYRFFTEREKA